MKKCFKCGVEKPLTEYYKHNRMADGHLNKCKSCTKADVSKHREENLEKVRAYDKSRNMLPNRVEARKKYYEDHQEEIDAWGKKYSKTEAGKAAKKAGSDNYKKKYPERVKASTAVGNAVRDGMLERPKKCEICSRVCTPHGHHWSYEEENWLNVWWVCVHCHIDIHNELRAEARGGE